jgi:hypothetical protein
VVGAEAGRSCSNVTAAKPSGRWSSKGVNGVPVARVPEGGGEVGKLLRDDVVLTGCSARARRWWISGLTARPSGGGAGSSSALWSGSSGALERDWMGWGAPAGDGDAVCALDQGWGAVVGAVDGEAERAAELELTGAAGNNARVRENGIEWVDELQGVTVVLYEHWIRVRGWCRWLTTVGRRRGGGPVRGGGRRKTERAKCVCANARVSVLGALGGGARGPEEDGVAREPELIAGGVHGGHGRGSGRGGGGVARGEEGSEESYGGGRPESDMWGHREAGGGADRVAMTASGSERRLGQTTGGVARRGEASAGSGKAAARQGKARGRVQSGAGAAGARHMAGRAAAARGQRSRGGRERGRRKRTEL